MPSWAGDFGEVHKSGSASNSRSGRWRCVDVQLGVGLQSPRARLICSSIKRGTTPASFLPSCSQTQLAPMAATRDDARGWTIPILRSSLGTPRFRPGQGVKLILIALKNVVTVSKGGREGVCSSNLIASQLTAHHSLWSQIHQS